MGQKGGFWARNSTGASVGLSMLMICVNRLTVRLTEDIFMDVTSLSGWIVTTAQKFFCFYHTIKGQEIQPTSCKRCIKKYLQDCLQAKKRKKPPPAGLLQANTVQLHSLDRPEDGTLQTTL
jgi:hypothetical protein